MSYIPLNFIPNNLNLISFDVTGDTKLDPDVTGFWNIYCEHLLYRGKIKTLEIIFDDNKKILHFDNINKVSFDTTVSHSFKYKQEGDYGILKIIGIDNANNKSETVYKVLIEYSSPILEFIDWQPQIPNQWNNTYSLYLATFEPVNRPVYTQVYVDNTNVSIEKIDENNYSVSFGTSFKDTYVDFEIILSNNFKETKYSYKYFIEYLYNILFNNPNTNLCYIKLIDNQFLVVLGNIKIDEIIKPFIVIYDLLNIKTIIKGYLNTSENYNFLKADYINGYLLVVYNKDDYNYLIVKQNFNNIDDTKYYLVNISQTLSKTYEKFDIAIISENKILAYFADYFPSPPFPFVFVKIDLIQKTMKSLLYTCDYDDTDTYPSNTKLFRIQDDKAFLIANTEYKGHTLPIIFNFDLETIESKLFRNLNDLDDLYLYFENLSYSNQIIRDNNENYIIFAKSRFSDNYILLSINKDLNSINFIYKVPFLNLSCPSLNTFSSIKSFGSCIIIDNKIYISADCQIFSFDILNKICNRKIFESTSENILLEGFSFFENNLILLFNNFILTLNSIKEISSITEYNLQIKNETNSLEEINNNIGDILNVTISLQQTNSNTINETYIEFIEI